MTTIQVNKIQVRRGTGAVPQLSPGELGWDEGQQRLYIGNLPEVSTSNTEILTQTSSVTIPIATTTTAGAVIVGNGIQVDTDGKISTITSGTVTSVDLAAGTTGLTFTGGPITSSGTITVGGVLAIEHGGTGADNKIDALKNLLPDIDENSGKFLYTNGSTIIWKSAELGFTPVNKEGDTMTGLLTLNADPVVPLGAATKKYVDTLANGMLIQPSCDTATTVSLNAVYTQPSTGVGATLVGTAGNLPAIGGVSLSPGNRVLVKNQASPLQNGVYIVTQITAPWKLTRAPDYDNNPIGGKIQPGDTVFVERGTLQGTQWVMISPEPISLGSTAINWTQFSGPGTMVAGPGISISNNVISNSGVVTINSGNNIAVTSADGVATISLAGVVPIERGGTNADTAIGASNNIANFGQLYSTNSWISRDNSLDLGAIYTWGDQSYNLTFVGGKENTRRLQLSIRHLDDYLDVRYVTNNAWSSFRRIKAGHADTATSVTGIIPITQGGTGASDRNTALRNLLPTQTANATRQLALNSSGGLFWADALGTVTSVDLSGGTTGLTVSGGPITSSGTLTIGGILNVANGGTGVSGFSGAGWVKANGQLPFTISSSITPDDISGNISIGKGGTGASNRIDALKNLLPPTTSVPNGSVLITDSVNGIFWGAAASAPGGSSGQLQFNNNGVLSGTSAITVNASTGVINFSQVPTINGVQVGYNTLPVATAFNSSAMGKRVVLSNTSPVSVSQYPAGSTFSFYNPQTLPVNFVPVSGLTLRLDGTTETGNRVLVPYGTCVLWYASTTEAIITGSIE